MAGTQKIPRKPSRQKTRHLQGILIGAAVPQLNFLLGVYTDQSHFSSENGGCFLDRKAFNNIVENDPDKWVHLADAAVD